MTATPDRGLTAPGFPANGQLAVPVGVVDRPYDQRRDVLWAELAGAAGHVVVAGGPQSGKSTLLRTLVAGAALTHTPAEVQFYAVDLGGGTLSGLAGLPHVGTVTSFCIVNVQFYGQAMEVPYTSALIMLDGADLSLMHLLQEVAVEDVHIGMRVEAVWVDDDKIGPTLESIRYFKPNGEPDADVHQPGEHGWGDLEHA